MPKTYEVTVTVTVSPSKWSRILIGVVVLAVVIICLGIGVSGMMLGNQIANTQKQNAIATQQFVSSLQLLKVEDVQIIVGDASGPCATPYFGQQLHTFLCWDNKVVLESTIVNGSQNLVYVGLPYERCIAEDQVDSQRIVFGDHEDWTALVMPGAKKTIYCSESAVDNIVLRELTVWLGPSSRIYNSCVSATFDIYSGELTHVSIDC